MSQHDPLNPSKHAQETAEEAARRANDAKTEQADLTWLMSDPRGRRICARALRDAGVYRTSFNTNALTMAFLEGSRQQGLVLLAKLTEICPAQYDQLLKEYRERQ